MAMDRLHCMQVFVRVVEQGSFTRAADDLGISRSSVTAAFAELEARLNVRLMNRTTRRLSLTDEGRSYYEHCVRVLDDIAEAEDNLSGTRLAPRGRLRVSIPQSFVDEVFFPALMKFMRHYPQLTVEIVLTDRAVNLVEEGIDCALRAAPIASDADLVARSLCSCSLITCVSRDYFAKNGQPRTLDELADHDCIQFVSPSTGRVRDWEFLIDGRLKTVTPHGRLRLNSLNATMESAVAGGGVAQIPDALAYRAILDGSLRAVLTDWIAPALPISLVYPGNRYVSAKVRVFADYFSDVFPRAGWWHGIEASRAAANAPTDLAAL